MDSTSSLSPPSLLRQQSDVKMDYATCKLATAGE